MPSLRDRPSTLLILTVFFLGLVGGCSEDQIAAPNAPPPFAFCGGWLAPRGDAALDSERGAAVVEKMRGLGVRWVAVGQDVTMPSLSQPKLVWGKQDAELRGFLRRVRKIGLQSFLVPRIESPDFFKPPYPFRADIRFETAAEWQRFHRDLERMILHYARLAEAEGVALFGLGLELKHSVRHHAEYWRQLIVKVRRVYRGQLTYSANWHDEWRNITFWSDLDFIGIGAYFELQGPESPGAATAADLVGRWAPTVRELAAASAREGRPVLFTEVGYTGYVDCAERPWEWAGKADKGVAIDHAVQARALRALFEVVGANECIAGLFVWSFYTDPSKTAQWEYAVQGRPAEDEIRRAYFR